MGIVIACDAITLSQSMTFFIEDDQQQGFSTDRVALATVPAAVRGMPNNDPRSGDTDSELLH